MNGLLLVVLCAVSGIYADDSRSLEDPESGGDQRGLYDYGFSAGGGGPSGGGFPPYGFSEDFGQQHELAGQNQEVHENVKTIIVTKKVPVPYAVHVEKKVPYPVKVTVRRPYTVFVPKPYLVEIPKPVPYTLKVPVPQPYTVEKHVPVPYKVTVDKPVPVQVPKPYPVFVEKKVPYPVEKHVAVHVKVPVERPYPVHVPVEKPVPYPVEKPVPVPVEVHVDRPVPVEVEHHYPVHFEKPVPYQVEKLVPYQVQVPVGNHQEVSYGYEQVQESQSHNGDAGGSEQGSTYHQGNEPQPHASALTAASPNQEVTKAYFNASPQDPAQASGSSNKEKVVSFLPGGSSGREKHPNQEAHNHKNAENHHSPMGTIHVANLNTRGHFPRLYSDGHNRFGGHKLPNNHKMVGYRTHVSHVNPYGHYSEPLESANSHVSESYFQQLIPAKAHHQHRQQYQVFHPYSNQVKHVSPDQSARPPTQYHINHGYEKPPSQNQGEPQQYVAYSSQKTQDGKQEYNTRYVSPQAEYSKYSNHRQNSQTKNVQYVTPTSYLEPQNNGENQHYAVQSGANEQKERPQYRKYISPQSHDEKQQVYAISQVQNLNVQPVAPPPSSQQSYNLYNLSQKGSSDPSHNQQESQSQYATEKTSTYRTHTAVNSNEYGMKRFPSRQTAIHNQDQVRHRPEEQNYQIQQPHPVHQTNSDIVVGTLKTYRKPTVAEQQGEYSQPESVQEGGITFLPTPLMLVQSTTKNYHSEPNGFRPENNNRSVQYQTTKLYATSGAPQNAQMITLVPQSTSHQSYAYKDNAKDTQEEVSAVTKSYAQSQVHPPERHSERFEPVSQQPQVHVYVAEEGTNEYYPVEQQIVSSTMKVRAPSSYVHTTEPVSTVQSSSQATYVTEPTQTQPGYVQESTEITEAAQTAQRQPNKHRNKSKSKHRHSLRLKQQQAEAEGQDLSSYRSTEKPEEVLRTEKVGRNKSRKRLARPQASEETVTESQAFTTLAQEETSQDISKVPRSHVHVSQYETTDGTGEVQVQSKAQVFHPTASKDQSAAASSYSEIRRSFGRKTRRVPQKKDQ